MKSIHFAITLIGASCFSIGSGADAVTFENVLQTTLEKNPAIQEAQLNVEQTAGQRLVLRSIMWPSVRARVPAGGQRGQRGGVGGGKRCWFRHCTVSPAVVDARLAPP